MRVLGIDCEFEGFYLQHMTWIWCTWVGFGFSLGTPFRSHWWKSHHQYKAIISSLIPNDSPHHHGCNHNKQSPPRCCGSSKLNAAEHQLCTHTGNTDSLLNECNAHVRWLKWEMKARCGVQSPGLEISIWVTAHKHLPDCAQRSTGIRSEVMKVFHHPSGCFRIPLSCLYCCSVICADEKKILWLCNLGFAAELCFLHITQHTSLCSKRINTVTLHISWSCEVNILNIMWSCCLVGFHRHILCCTNMAYLCSPKCFKCAFSIV